MHLFLLYLVLAVLPVALGQLCETNYQGIYYIVETNVLNENAQAVCLENELTLAQVPNATTALGIAGLLATCGGINLNILGYQGTGVDVDSCAFLGLGGLVSIITEPLCASLSAWVLCAETASVTTYISESTVSFTNTITITSTFTPTVFMSTTESFTATVNDISLTLETQTVFTATITTTISTDTTIIEVDSETVTQDSTDSETVTIATVTATNEFIILAISTTTVSTGATRTNTETDIVTTAQATVTDTDTVIDTSTILDTTTLTSTTVTVSVPITSPVTTSVTQTVSVTTTTSLTQTVSSVSTATVSSVSTATVSVPTTVTVTTVQSLSSSTSSTSSSTLCPTARVASCPCQPGRDGLVMIYNSLPYEEAGCACSRIGASLAILSDNEAKAAGEVLRSCNPDSYKGAWVQQPLGGGVCLAVYPNGHQVPVSCDGTKQVMCRVSPSDISCHSCQFEWTPYCRMYCGQVENVFEAMCFNPQNDDRECRYCHRPAKHCKCKANIIGNSANDSNNDNKSLMVVKGDDYEPEVREIINKSNLETDQLSITVCPIVTSGVILLTSIVNLIGGLINIDLACLLQGGSLLDLSASALVDVTGLLGDCGMAAAFINTYNGIDGSPCAYLAANGTVIFQANAANCGLGSFGVLCATGPLITPTVSTTTTRSLTSTATGSTRTATSTIPFTVSETITWTTTLTQTVSTLSIDDAGSVTNTHTVTVDETVTVGSTVTASVSTVDVDEVNTTTTSIISTTTTTVYAATVTQTVSVTILG